MAEKFISKYSSDEIENLLDQLSTLLANQESQQEEPQQQAISSSVPTGTIISYFGESAPEDYLICDGSEYNKADYPDLWTHLSGLTNTSAYISEDEDKFKVPDLRGEFLRGTGTNSHANQGSGVDVGNHQDATKHIYFYHSNSSYNLHKSDLELYPQNTDSEIDLPSNWTAIVNGGVASGDNSKEFYTSRPTNTSVLYCIKY